MDKVARLIEQWVADKNIPGAVLDISYGKSFRWQQAYGAYNNGTCMNAITLDTMFDAASLTKVAATLPAVLLLANRGLLKLDDKVEYYLPAFSHKGVTLRHLLQHSSGLPADLPRRDREQQCDVVAEIVTKELLFTPRSQVLYSDLGMILLGKIVELVSGGSLDKFTRREIHEPLGMSDTMYRPSEIYKERIAATEWNGNGYIWGEVHDEKCYQLGGVSGSAGIFTTASDLMKYTRSWLDSEDGLLPKRWRNECLNGPFRGRGLGWEMWPGYSMEHSGEVSGTAAQWIESSLQVSGPPAQQPTSSCGTNWPKGSFGHTGFTGTSIWIEPISELVVVFLTNAVHYGRGNPIRRLRPILHEAIYSSVIGG
jgi:CubicO group peptidase (beta-lactamase class C family)